MTNARIVDVLRSERIVQSLQNLRNSWARAVRGCLLDHRVRTGSSDAHSSAPALMRHNPSMTLSVGINAFDAFLLVVAQRVA